MSRLGRKVKTQNSGFKVPINFTLDQLDIMVLYLFTNNDTLIKRRDLIKMERLFSIINPIIYQSDDMLNARFCLIKDILNCRIKENIVNYNVLKDKCISESKFKDIVIDIFNELETVHVDDLNETEIKYTNKLISEHLNYAYLFRYKDELNEYLEEIELGTYNNLAGLNESFKNTLVSLMKDMRQAKPAIEEEQDFDISNEMLESVLVDTVEELKQPSNFLKCGIQTLNRMLNGGFEQARHYIFFAVSGVGKSVILLTLAYQIMKYNQDLKPKDPNKRLCVLYITQENSRKETIQRLWNIALSDEDITSLETNEVVKKFKESILCLDNSNINLKIIYRQNKSISTDDLYDIIDTINDEGEEVIAVLHDYTKRILPSKPTNDMRIDLGNVVDEETTIAKTYNIPFITAGQINRAGAAIAEEALQKGKEDIGKLMNSTNVGESFLMIGAKRYYERTMCVA